MTDHKPVNDLPEYLDAVLKAARDWQTPEGYGFRPWCRGHCSASWQLVPSIYRPQHAALDEDSLRWDFQLRAPPFLAPTGLAPATDLEWYFLMQHYGVPTRLLDWTESPLVALYFAVRDADADASPVIWLLDPWSLNSASGLGTRLLDCSDKEVVPEYLPPTNSMTDLPDGPAAIQPPLHSLRTVAQKGTFTIHGASKVPIEEIAALGSRLARIPIGPKRGPSIKDELFLVGVSETSVFPELSSLARDLLHYWSDRD